MVGKNVISVMPESFRELRIGLAARERWEDSGYEWDNADRSEHGIVQLTLGGACYFESPEGSHIVEPGYAFLTDVPSRTRYGYWDKGEGLPYENLYLVLQGAHACGLLRAFRERFGPVINLVRRPECHSFFREISERFIHRSFRDRWEESALLFQFFAALYREAEDEAVRGDAVAACYRRILSRFREPANVSEIARDAGLSREHLARCFRERFGQSPSRMLRELRLREARALLASGELELDTVARATGFNDPRSLKRWLHSQQPPNK